MKKRLIIVTVCILLVYSIIFPGISVFAEDSNQQFITDANKLKNLGIIKGTGRGFELERTLNKDEASVILVRLLQKEEDALNTYIPISFEDVPDWAYPYVGYLYNRDMIASKTPLEFGAFDDISAEQFTEVMLKILGYDEAAGDFKSGQCLDMAKQIELLSDSEFKSITESKAFDRKQAVLVIYNTLKTSIKGSRKALINKLLEEGNISKDRVTLIEEGDRVEDIIAYAPVTKIRSGSSAPIAFLGDSLTEGIFHVEKFMGYTTLNRGLNGYTTRKILNRINEVVDARPKKLFLMAGTNDMWGGEKVQTTVKNYTMMLDIIREHVPECKIYIQSTLPFGEAALKRNSKASNDKVKELNKQLVLLAKKYGATYLDIGSLYKDSKGRMGSKFTIDGIHLKLEYYAPWLKVIKKKI